MTGMSSTVENVLKLPAVDASPTSTDMLNKVSLEPHQTAQSPALALHQTSSNATLLDAVLMKYAHKYLTTSNAKYQFLIHVHPAHVRMGVFA